MDFKKTSIENYTYQLTDEKIAKYPLAKRDESKLLVFPIIFLKDCMILSPSAINITTDPDVI